MKLSIISFWPDPRIVAKFQTDRFRTFGENRAQIKKNKETHAAKNRYPRRCTLRLADAAGSMNQGCSNRGSSAVVKSCIAEDGEYRECDKSMTVSK